jgi:hypothetical protein
MTTFDFRILRDELDNKGRLSKSLSRSKHWISRAPRRAPIPELTRRTLVVPGFSQTS